MLCFPFRQSIQRLCLVPALPSSSEDFLFAIKNTNCQSKKNSDDLFRWPPPIQPMTIPSEVLDLQNTKVQPPSSTKRTIKHCLSLRQAFWRQDFYSKLVSGQSSPLHGWFPHLVFFFNEFWPFSPPTALSVAFPATVLVFLWNWTHSGAFSSHLEVDYNFLVILYSRFGCLVVISLSMGDKPPCFIFYYSSDYNGTVEG